MKKQTTATGFFTSLTNQAMEKLTSIVPETIATVVPAATKKQFSAADLWNIQRQKRSFVQRRFAL